MAELVVSVSVAATVEQAWAALVEWENHGDWMLLTKVRRTTTADASDIGEADGVGTGIEGITGIGPFAVRDTMTFSQWQPPPARPARCVVEHTGKLVRGSGAFEVDDSGDPGADPGAGPGADHCVITWSEWVLLPLGLLGELGWLAVRPLARLFLRISLRRLARLIEAGALA